MAEGNDLPSTALVAVAPATLAPRVRLAPRRHAAFLAHLLAVADKVPQMRERCRAEPREAAAAYRAAIERFSVQ